MFAVSSLLAFTLAATLPTAHAFFRIACSGNTLLHERVDPIVSPGVPANHLHVIHGGNAFSSNYTYEDARRSSCTSCEVTDDLSNYWTPALWFHDKKNNKFEPVPNGGLLVYYQQRGDDKNIQPFPPGLRMISGDMKARSKKFAQEDGSQEELAERAVQYACLRYSNGQTGYDGQGFPNTRCEAGFQSRLHFQNCWDGKNLDSDNHKDHVAFMSILDNGKCPDTHPVALMSMFFEVTWDIKNFDDRWNPDAGDEWPFVYSQGDPSGFGFHGDFVNGWNTDVLKAAITDCDNNTPGTAGGDATQCPHFKMQSKDQAAQCTKAPEFNEAIDGVLDRLPGCNPIQPGPEVKVYSPGPDCPLDGTTPDPAPAPAPAPAPEPQPAPEPAPAPEDPEPAPEDPEPAPEPAPAPPAPTPPPAQAPGPVAPPPPTEATVTVTQTDPAQTVTVTVTETATGGGATETVTTTVTSGVGSCTQTSNMRQMYRSGNTKNGTPGRAHPSKFQPRRR